MLGEMSFADSASFIFQSVRVCLPFKYGKFNEYVQTNGYCWMGGIFC